MKNANFHTGDVKRTCEAKLGIEFRPGKEFNGWYWFKNRKVARITIQFASRIASTVAGSSKLLRSPGSKPK